MASPQHTETRTETAATGRAALDRQRQAVQPDLFGVLIAFAIIWLIPIFVGPGHRVEAERRTCSCPRPG
jgi:hypothetical protein